MTHVAVASAEANRLTFAPTRAIHELQDEAALDAHGIALPIDQARLVLTALSRVIANGQSKARPAPYVLATTLAFVCALDYERDGVVYPAPHPNLRDTSCSEGKTVFKRLGITHRDLDDYWVVARNRAHDACLPIEWVVAFVPPTIWPAVITMIAWGPDQTRARLEEALIVYARTPVRNATRRRSADAKLSASTLKNRISAIWLLIDCLVDLRRRVVDSAAPTLPRELLEAWMFKPSRPSATQCGAREARLEASGPALDDCSRRLKELVTEYEAAPPNSRYRRLRSVLLLALLSLYGPRLDALRLLRVEDIIENFVFADGIRGPALRLYPGKTRAPDDAFMLPLPSEIHELLKRWIELNERKYRTSGAGPLFPSTHRPTEPLDQSGLYCAIAGRANKMGGGSFALLPRNGDPYIGYHPHAFRHTAYTAAARAGAAVKQQSPHEFGHIHPEDFARAICAHSMGRSVSDTYRDLNQHKLARAAIEEAWSHLRGKLRRGLDPNAIAAAHEHVKTTTEAITHSTIELEQLETEVELIASTATPDSLNEALLQSNRLLNAIRAKDREVSRHERELELANHRLNEALVNEVMLPDDLDTSQYENRLQTVLEQLELGGRPVDETVDASRSAGRSQDTVGRHAIPVS